MIRRSIRCIACTLKSAVMTENELREHGWCMHLVDGCYQWFCAACSERRETVQRAEHK